LLVGDEREADPGRPTKQAWSEQRSKGEEEVHESLAVEFLRQGNLVTNARGRESPPVPDRETAAGEPEPEGGGADDRRELGQMEEMSKELVRVRETWVLEEANDPRLAPPVWMCSPYEGERVCMSRGLPPVRRGCPR
jgi:hypothetical protein